MAPAPRPRRATLAAAVSVLVCGPVLSGCTGTPDTPVAAASPSAASPSAQLSPSAASTAGSTPATPAAVPDPPHRPAATRGPRAQRAFARYVMATWSWSLRTNDATPLMRSSPSRTRPCDGCRALARELARRTEEGWYVDFPGLRVGRIRLSERGTRTLATARVVVPASRTYFDDGTYRSTNPAHRGVEFSVLMEPRRNGHRLLAFSVTG